MANLRLISVDITGDKELVAVLNEFNRLVTLPKEQKTKESSKRAQEILKDAEIALKNRLGATLVSGKLGKTEVADLRMPADSPITKFLYNNIRSEYQRYLSTTLEVKASTARAATIGQITITSGKTDYRLPGETEKIVGSDFLKKLGIEGDGYLLDLDPRTRNLSDGADITNIVFGDYFKKDSRLRKIFYAKASSLVLATNQDGTGNKLVFLQIPVSKFNENFFKANITDKAIKISINNSFQNAIINFVNETHIKAIQRSTSRPVKETIIAAGKKVEVDFISRNILSGSLSYGLEITNSIKTRPTDTIRPRVTLPKETQSKKESKQSFISGVQWTVLTQRRLGETMLKLGDPEPPDLKERSGRFRGSVQVFANYRTSTLQYIYNPLYSSLHKYGYRPDLQVETAIREVAQSLYAQKFNIVRGNRV